MAIQQSDGSAGLPVPVDVSADETEQLRGERDFWKGLFEQVVREFPEPAFVVDDEGTLTHFNERAEDAFGIDAVEAVGRRGYEAFQTEGQSEILAETVARTNEVVREDDYRTVSKAGRDDVYARAMGIPLSAPDGTVVGALEMTTDVTDIVEQRNRLEAAQKQVTDELGAAVEQTRVSAERVAENVEQASELAERQAENMEEVSGEVGSLSATVEEIAASAEEINEKSGVAERLAEESRQSAERTIDTMDEVAESSDEVAHNTRDLRERIGEIDAIVEVINDIADQTNLLALNANIEAARAGEAGAGFAVVADEVKTLAEEVQSESERIEQIVADIRTDADDTVDSVETVTGELRDGVERVESMVDNQTRIVETIHETSAGMDDIATATDDQAVRTEEVASMVDNAAGRADEVFDEMADAVTANEEQLEAVESIDRSVGHLKRTMNEI